MISRNQDAISIRDNQLLDRYKEYHRNTCFILHNTIFWPKMNENTNNRQLPLLSLRKGLVSKQGAGS